MFVSVRDFTVIWVGYKNLAEGLKELGIDKYEMHVNKKLSQDTYVDMGQEVKLGFNLRTPEERKNFVKFSESVGIEPCAILLENDFSNDNLKEEISYIKEATQLADDIGVKVIRINPHMNIKKDRSVEFYSKQFVEILTSIIEETNNSSVVYAVENHGYIGNNEQFLDYAFKEINSTRFGLTLDTGNFYWYGYPLSKVHQIIGKYARFVRHTHLKNLKYPENKKEVQRKPGEGFPKVGVPLYEGDIDFKKVVQLLKEANYNGDLTIEDESLGNYKRNERKEILKKDVEFIKNLIHK
ncbi:MAG: sugar phosphate isomerase/epimerase family protein [Thermoproteota archaeon]|nr:sugar phosphate isomerase/epimerase [Candidatus Brockarchaeota archaeon]